MLRRWDSIVFSLRKSSAAISLFVLPVGDQLGDLELALGQRVDPGLARRRPAGLAADAELAQLAADRVALAKRAAGVELALGLAQLLDRLLALAGGGERPAEQAAREGGLQRRAGRGRALDPDSRRRQRRLRFALVRAGSRPGSAPASAAGSCRSSPAASVLGPLGVAFGGLDVAGVELGEREPLPVEAALDRDRELDLLAAERPHRLEARSVSPEVKSATASAQPGPPPAEGIVPPVSRSP